MTFGKSAWYIERCSLQRFAIDYLHAAIRSTIAEIVTMATTETRGETTQLRTRKRFADSTKREIVITDSPVNSRMTEQKRQDSRTPQMADGIIRPGVTTPISDNSGSFSTRFLSISRLPDRSVVGLAPSSSKHLTSSRAELSTCRK